MEEGYSYQPRSTPSHTTAQGCSYASLSDLLATMALVGDVNTGSKRLERLVYYLAIQRREYQNFPERRKGRGNESPSDERQSRKRTRKCQICGPSSSRLVDSFKGWHAVYRLYDRQRQCRSRMAHPRAVQMTTAAGIRESGEGQSRPPLQRSR